MLNEDKLKRISELGRKKKAEGLTEAETKEQAVLREEYLKNFRRAFKKNVEGIKVVDPEGNDLTSEKVKEIQRENGLRSEED
ncbi:DUF896 domain-containing protein [Aerococcaceae bacterium DSM 111176]|nr:DUF896 domain-containing protein [Aerococcaceae bacterium DSM 111176]